MRYISGLVALINEQNTGVTDNTSLHTAHFKNTISKQVTIYLIDDYPSLLLLITTTTADTHMYLTYLVSVCCRIHPE